LRDAGNAIAATSIVNKYSARIPIDPVIPARNATPRHRLRVVRSPPDGHG
jgi:hypothetical protein